MFASELLRESGATAAAVSAARQTVAESERALCERLPSGGVFTCKRTATAEERDAAGEPDAVLHAREPGEGLRVREAAELLPVYWTAVPRVQGEPVLAAAEEEGRERARAPGERTGAGAGRLVRRAQHVRNLGGNLMVFCFCYFS